MTAPLPAPLVSAEVDLTNLPYMPILIARLKQSRAWLMCKRRPELAFYLVNLWTAAWHGRPAASLENDDDVLADLAMCDPRAWKRVKAEVLRGWVECSDGRIYHPVVAEQALVAWGKKVGHRDKMEAARAAKEARRAEKGGDASPSKKGVQQSNGTAMEGSIIEPDKGSDIRPDKGSETGLKGREGKGRDSSVLKDGTADPEAKPEPAKPPPFRSVLDQPPLRLVQPEPEPDRSPDPTAAERELFDRGKAVLGKSAGGQITKLLKAKGNVALARAAIETSSTKHNPREYIAAAIRGDDTGRPPGELYDRSI